MENEQKIEIHAFTITDPLSGKLDWNLPEGFERDYGQVLQWSDEQVKEFLLKNDYKYFAVPALNPVTLLITPDGKKHGVESKSEEFSTLKEMVDRVTKDDCIIYSIWQNLNSGNFRLRYFTPPENFDPKFNQYYAGLCNAINTFAKKVNQKFKLDDTFESKIYNFYHSIIEDIEDKSNDSTDGYINQLKKTNYRY